MPMFTASAQVYGYVVGLLHRGCGVGLWLWLWLQHRAMAMFPGCGFGAGVWRRFMPMARAYGYG